MTKLAICKKCGKEYEVQMIPVTRGGKETYVQKSYWCSPLCQRIWNTEVRAK